MNPEHAYEQLERVRHLLRNAELNPLPDAKEQALVVSMLEGARTIYRRHWDGRKVP